MYYLFLILFVFAAMLILLQIYKISTYHKDFPKMIPILILYGTAIAFLLNLFKFHESFITVTLVMIVYLIANYMKNKKLNPAIFTSVDGSDIKLQVELSLEKTLKHHLLSSILFIVSFIVSFILFFNA